MASLSRPAIRRLRSRSGERIVGDSVRQQLAQALAEGKSTPVTQAPSGGLGPVDSSQGSYTVTGRSGFGKNVTDLRASRPSLLPDAASVAQPGAGDSTGQQARDALARRLATRRTSAPSLASMAQAAKRRQRGRY